MTGWADPDRWKHRRRLGVPDEPLPEGVSFPVNVSSLKLRSPNYHITELDGVTPLRVDSVVKMDDDGTVLWVKQSAESEKGFYIYYDEHIVTPIDEVLTGESITPRHQKTERQA